MPHAKPRQVLPAGVGARRVAPSLRPPYRQTPASTSATPTQRSRPVAPLTRGGRRSLRSRMFVRNAMPFRLTGRCVELRTRADRQQPSSRIGRRDQLQRLMDEALVFSAPRTSPTSPEDRRHKSLRHRTSNSPRGSKLRPCLCSLVQTATDSSLGFDRKAQPVAGPAPTLRANDVELSASALAAGAEEEDRTSTPASPARSVGKSGWDTDNLHHLLHRLDPGAGGDISADLDGIGPGYQAHRAHSAGASRPGPHAASARSELAGLLQHARIDAALVLDQPPPGRWCFRVAHRATS